MASNNLRVVYDNLVDSTTITTTLSASSAVLPVSNLTTDTKSLVWRTATAPAATAVTTTAATPTNLVGLIDNKTNVSITSISAGSGNTITCSPSVSSVNLGKSIRFSGASAGGLSTSTTYYIVSVSGSNIGVATSPNASTFKVNLMATFSSARTVGAVILPFTNLTKTATITVKGYTGTNNNTYPSIGSGVTSPTITTSGCTQVFAVTNVLCSPWSLSGSWSWSGSGTGVNSFSYGGGNYARVYIPLAQQAACTSITIEISDQYNTDRYIEASRLIIGSYWSPEYNTNYGLSAGITDLSLNERSESGNLVTNRGPKFSTLNFDLGYMTANDRNNLFSILRGSGISKPIFVSLFPDDAEPEKERDYQIYGKLSDLSPVTNSTLSFYSSNIQLEEI